MIICVTGPTGIGKTKLSVMLAKKYNGIIINADATQIYKGLDIGSAKVTESEMEGVKHYLIDIKNPNEDYSVADFQIDARKILDDNKNKNVIVVGGTGLYIKALFYDYVFDSKNYENYDNLTNDELYELVLKKDSTSKIHKNNRVRMINFLNSSNSANNGDKLLYDVKFIGLTIDRDILYDRVNLRVDKMINDGLIKEVEDLYKLYPNSNILKRAIGYKEIIDYLNKKTSLEEAINKIKQNTRHYVKRQYTWFNNQMNLKWFNVNLNNFNETYDEVIKYIESN